MEMFKFNKKILRIKRNQLIKEKIMFKARNNHQSNKK